MVFHGMGAQVFQAAPGQGAVFGGLEHDAGGVAGLQCLLPARGAEAPAVAGLEAGEAVLRQGGGEVVADGAAVGEEACRHDRADGVAAVVFGAGAAGAVAEEAGDGAVGAGGERAAEPSKGRRRLMKNVLLNSAFRARQRRTREW